MSRNDKADFYLSCMKALKQNSDRAAFCRAKADETKDALVKMSYLAEASGLFQANANILIQLRKDGLID